MRVFCLTAGFVVLALLMASGCISSAVPAAKAPGVTMKDAGAAETLPEAVDYVPEEITVEEPVKEMAKELPEGALVSVTGIETDKDVYHSRELLSFNVTIDSSVALDDVTVRASGISGKMDIAEMASLAEGENVVEFEYTLPSCNRCSGISPGDHEVSVHLVYGDVIAEDSIAIEIQQ